MDTLFSDEDLGIAPAATPAGGATPAAPAPDPSLQDNTSPPITLEPGERIIGSNSSIPASQRGNPPALFSDEDFGIQPPVDTGTDVAKGFGAGVVKGTTGLLGMPGDIANMVGKLGDRAVLGLAHTGMDWTGLGPQAGTPERAQFDQDWRNVGTDSDLPTSSSVLGHVQDATGPLYQAKTGLGQFADTAGQFVPMAIAGPESLAQKATLGVLAPAAGVQAAKTLIPNSPAAEMAGAVAGAVGGHLVQGGVNAARAGMGKVGEAFNPVETPWNRPAPVTMPDGSPVLDSTGQPISATPKQQQMAGQKFTSAALDPGAVKENLANIPANNIDGFKPTTGQLTGDLGILSEEKTAAVQNPVPFQARAGQQNKANVGAMTGLQPSGSAEDLASGLKAQLAQLDAAEAANETAATQRAQDAATSIGGHQSPDYYGRQIQGQVQPQVNAARQEVAGSLNRLGGTGTPEEAGATLRAAAADSGDAVRQARNRLYNAIDPDGKLNIVATGPRARAQEISQGISKLDAQPAGQEATILGQMRKLPDVIKFRDLQALDKNITGAMSAEMRAAGQTPAWGRLTQLKGAVQDAIANGVENQIAYERQAVAKGQIAPELTLESRLNDLRGFADRDPYASSATGTEGGSFFPARPVSGPVEGTSVSGPPPIEGKPPQSLVAFLRMNGGLKDSGGELASRELHKQFPGLMNHQTGLPLDRAREAAAEAGYLGGDTERAVRETDINDLLHAIDNHPTYAASDYDRVIGRDHRQDFLKDRAANRVAINDLRNSLKSGGYDPNSVPKEIMQEAAALVRGRGLDWREALQTASEHSHEDKLEAARHAQFRASQEQSYNHPSLGDAGERFGAESSAESGRGQFRAPGEAGGGRGAGEALSPNFDQAAADRLETAKQSHAEYAQTFKQGPVGQMLKTNGFAGQYKLLDSGVPNLVFKPGAQGAETVQAYMRAAGSNPDAVNAVRNYAATSLRRAAVDADGNVNIKKYTDWLRSNQDALRAMPGGLQEFGQLGRATEALNRFHPFTGDLAPSAVPEMFFHSGPSGGEAVANLRGLIGDQAATSTLSDYAASKLRSVAMKPDGTLDPSRVAQFAKTHSPALDAIPGLQDKFSTAAKATHAINEAAATRKQTVDAYQKGAVGKILGSTEGADITRMVGDVFGKTDSVAQMRDLAGKAQKAGPDAVEGLRKAAADSIIQKFMSNTEVAASGTNKLSDNSFQTFMRTKVPALAQVFKPEEIKTLQSIADNIAMMKRSRDATILPGHSPSAQLINAVKKAQGEQHGSLLEALFKGSFAAREISESLHGVPIIGAALMHAGVPIAAATAVGKHLVNAMQAAGMKKVSDLYEAAILHPEVARELMSKAPIAKAAPAQTGLGKSIMRLVPFYGRMSNQ